MDLSNENVIHVKRGSQEFLQFKKLLQYSDIIEHAYSLGIDKNYRTVRRNRMPIEDEEFYKSVENYKTLCSSVGLEAKHVIKARQSHTDKIRQIEKDLKEIEIEEYADGLVTNKNKIILATTNADCILMLFFDPEKKVIANVHSGWRGTVQKISVKTLYKMNELYGTNPKDVIVCMTPSIRKCHFEVDRDVYDLFFSRFGHFKEIDDYIDYNKEKEKWYIDTIGINKLILMREGVLEENIIDSKICSVCSNELVHSYRAEGKGYGLATAIISIK